MEIDPLEHINDDENDDDEIKEELSEEHKQEKRRSRLNAWVAITVALLATFMGICKVKDDNIVQAMQQAQAKSIDDWNYYQARNIRAELAQATADQLSVLASSQQGTAQDATKKLVQSYVAIAKEQETKKVQTKADAEGDQKAYNAYNYHDDQFDLSDALVSIAISLFALTSLTQKRWLFGLALIPTFFGVLMGLAGLLGWHIHPDALTNLLS
jgi:hypothetical protein